MKKILIILFIFCVSILVSASYADNLADFDHFLKDLETVEEFYKNKKVDFISILIKTESLKKKSCVVEKHEDYSYISPACLLDVPSYFSMEDSLKYFYKNLDNFYHVYLQDSYEFTYKATKPHYYYSIFDKYLKYRGSMYEKMVLLYRDYEDKKIKVDNYILARLMFENYSFYSVPTTLLNRGPCSLNNYKLAVGKINGLVLKPGEILNLNSLVANDENACRGRSTKSFLFYGGSCGASSQLFKLSLIMPRLTVLNRVGHTKRWALYYGPKIMGDDAAMYENSQKFIIRNDFDTSIAFAAYEKGDYIYLVGIVPKNIDQYVDVVKHIEGRHASVFKVVYDVFGNIVGKYQFDSDYTRIETGRI